MKQGRHESTEYPLLLEKTKRFVYVRNRIEEEERDGVLFYTYDEAAYTHEEWKEREIEQLKADVLYMSLMTGVDLDV